MTHPIPRHHRLHRLLALGLTLFGLGCPAAPAPKGEHQPASTSEHEGAKPSKDDGPEFVLAPETGDVIAIVEAEQARASADARMLLVYVGASWCEPCQYFHAAVDEGTLDDSLAGVRLLEFDLDRDGERLAAAGYRSRLIPLFVAPGPDGRAGPRRTEGGVKGPAAVDNLRERLVALINAARADQG